MSRKTISKEDKIKKCNAIFDLMAEGESLSKASKAHEIDNKTAREWISALGLSPHYDTARSFLQDFWADEILDIADDTTNDFIETETGVRLNAENVQRSRLRIDTRKWLLSKLSPKKYGDKLDLSSTDGTMTPPSRIELVAAKSGD